MIGDNKITSRAAKDILAIMYKDGGDPQIIAEKNNLLQKSDVGELTTIIKKIKFLMYSIFGFYLLPHQSYGSFFY